MTGTSFTVMMRVMMLPLVLIQLVVSIVDLVMVATICAKRRLSWRLAAHVHQPLLIGLCLHFYIVGPPEISSSPGVLLYWGALIGTLSLNSMALALEGPRYAEVYLQHYRPPRLRVALLVGWGGAILCTLVVAWLLNRQLHVQSMVDDILGHAADRAACNGRPGDGEGGNGRVDYLPRDNPEVEP